MSAQRAAGTAGSFDRGHEAVNRLQSAVEDVLRGKSDQVRLALSCLVAGGHLLIEDNPGTGKTSLAKAIAGAVGGVARRVQFTPDLLPSDITGITIFNPATGTFTFREGPTFTNILVADEINRASPKTQAALLEVMEERQVTTDGVTRRVPEPFMVVATQNPLDFQGTYPLPEVQLDRFAMKLTLGYAPRESELEIMARGRRPDAPVVVESVLTISQFNELTGVADDVAVAAPLREYIADIIGATRTHQDLRLGVSTRGALTLIGIGRAYALACGRPFVTPDDIKLLAVPVLAHRMAVTSEAEIDGVTEVSVIESILSTLPVPRHRESP